MIKEDVINSVLLAVNLVEIVQERMPLKKAGRNFKAPCPFHSEKTPSFVVSPDKQIFHCFGCGAGGNAIGFVMKYDKISFREALQALAAKGKITLPISNMADDRTSGEDKKIIEMNTAAKDFFKKSVLSEDGRAGYKYFKDRGIQDDMLDLFELGYAPNGWDGLINSFAKNGIDAKTMENAGLAILGEDGKRYYDRFRNRVMFPIYDVANRVIAFGGRTMTNSIPKYINSPETRVYVKGRNLYGLNHAKNVIREKGYVILVEGYLDMILPFQHGIKNIVATCGTALTPEQIKLLKRFTNTVVILYDADKAGEEASLRGMDILISFEMNVRIATLPAGHDPDTFVREKGKDGFDQIINSSRDLFDYKMGLLMKKFNKEGVRGRAAIANFMLPTISRIPNEVLKSSFVKKLSDVLEIDEAALKAELAKIRPDYSYTVTLSENAPSEIFKPASSAELMLLGIILDEPGRIEEIRTKLGGGFSDGRLNQILGKVTEIVITGGKVMPSALMTYYEDESIKTMIAAATSARDTVSDVDKAIADCVIFIKKNHDKQARMDLNKKIEQAQESKQPNELEALYSRYNSLLKTHKG